MHMIRHVLLMNSIREGRNSSVTIKILSQIESVFVSQK